MSALFLFRLDSRSEQSEHQSEQQHYSREAKMQQVSFLSTMEHLPH